MSVRSQRWMHIRYIIISLAVISFFIFLKLFDNHTSNLQLTNFPSIKEGSRRNTSSVSCNIDNILAIHRLQQYKQLNFDFYRLKFEYMQDYILGFIGNKSVSHCTQTDTEWIFNFSHNNSSKPNIAILTIIILPDHPSNLFKTKHGLNIFGDIRTYHLKLANAIRYAQINEYSLIFNFKAIYRYAHKGNNTELKQQYETNMNLPMNQKPFFVSKYLLDYDWLLWMDYDAMFLNCRLTVEQSIINTAYSLHRNSELISLIFGGEYYTTINDGVWLMRNNEWSRGLLEKWMFIVENAEKYQLLKIHNFQQDQTVFVALLEGFHVDKSKIASYAYKDIQMKRNIASRTYIKRKLDIGLKEAYKNPIYDANISRYAVAIDETIINGKIYQFSKVNKQSMLVMHYYSKDKTEQLEVFNTFKYSLRQCFGRGLN